MNETFVLMILLNIVYNEVRALAQSHGVPTATGYIFFLARRRIDIMKDNRRRRRKWRG